MPCARLVSDATVRTAEPEGEAGRVGHGAASVCFATVRMQLINGDVWEGSRFVGKVYSHFVSTSSLSLSSPSFAAYNLNSRLCITDTSDPVAAREDCHHGRRQHLLRRYVGPCSGDTCGCEVAVGQSPSANVGAPCSAPRSGDAAQCPSWPSRRGHAWHHVTF